ncbi:glycosyltransferase family 2 protein [Bacteroides eggerthii]|jgi:GT2 family glycosyltransferase|uniref:glycosyltransferase family 2 protein n=1 Tax=Bacteroides eggerthii TaxID=28111 RepID=UPI00189CC11D|nr:glycosyltransferase family 2 protein [Bacteroides eggerthii]MCO7156000.1 glycosyltransferase family 2 protein [Bacteroides eggerthii]
MRTMDVSIIIVNYNTRQLTSNCIESIFKYTNGVSFEVILVDNASTDGSIDFFTNDERIIFISSKENLGFGRANNLGYKVAKGRYIFLLNSDTLLLNNAIKIFCDTMSNVDGNIACIGTLLRDKEMNVIHSYGSFPTIISVLKGTLDVYLFFLPKRRKNAAILTFPLEVDYVTGADLFIRRSVIEQLGLFDPDFFMYYEETEMQYRYHAKKYKSLIIDQPSILHLEGASGYSFSKSYKIEYFSTFGCFKYFKKTTPLFFYIVFRILFFLLRLVPVLLKPISMKNKLQYLYLLIRK